MLSQNGSGVEGALALFVETRPATSLGTTAMTMNAIIYPHARLTTYYFEYGPTTAYGQRTAGRALPARLALHYETSWDETWGAWKTESESQILTSGGFNRGFVRFSAPFGKDDLNHMDGFGPLRLLHLINSGPDAYDPRDKSPFTYPILGGGDPDLRGARLTVAIRGNKWKPHGSELLFWAQSQSNIEVRSKSGWRRANWALTGSPLTRYLMDGKWHRVSIELSNDTAKWTYAGNNLQQGRRSSRYEYWPLNDALAHLNVDFIFVLGFIDPKNPPNGTLDFDEFNLDFRNNSLLLPSNGGRLVSWPAGSPDDPATLTDGWRTGKGRMWRSCDAPKAPQEFVYRLDRDVTINTVQLHQNPVWPSKDVEVLTSVDGRSYASLMSGVMPPGSSRYRNSLFLAKTGLSAQARYVKLRIKSGYNATHWGLGELMIFGTGAEMLPDDRPCGVSADVIGLPPGRTCHYRIVAESGGIVARGKDCTLAVPNGDRPLVETGEAERLGFSLFHLQGRVNSLGRRCQCYFEYGADGRYGHFTKPVDSGVQVTPRFVVAELKDLAPNTTYHYRLVGKTDTSKVEGDDFAFTTGLDGLTPGNYGYFR